MRESVALFELKVNNATFRSKQQSSLSSSRIKRTQSTRWSPWKEIKATSSQIKCRCHHASVLVQNKLFVYGGFDNDTGILDDFKMFQIPDSKIQNQSKSKGSWVSMSMLGGPGARHSHTAVFYEGFIYIFGGKVDRFKNTNTLYSYSVKQNKWELVETFDSLQQKKESKKEVKESASAIAIDFNWKKNKNKEVKNEQKQKQNQNKPEGIDSHQAVVVKDQMIIYGGFSNNKFTNNVYSLNLKTRIWKKLYSDEDEKEQKLEKQYPEARGDFSMVEYNGNLYIYGGKNLNKSYNDLWEFSLNTLKFRQLSQQNIVKLQNRSGHSAIVYKDYMLIFGGILSVTHERDDLICYQFGTGRWLVIWNNSEIKGVLSQNKIKKSQSKKVSNHPKSPQNNISIIKNQCKEELKPGKYRRPIIEQKKGSIKKEQKTERDRYKKNNERKINLLNQIQTAIKPYEHMPCQRYSPLLQSLNNSIMITSSSHQSGINSKDINYNTSNILKEQKLMNRSSLIEGQCCKQKKLKPRDGHSAHLYNDEMIIFGGDRHKIALNDIVFISLQIALQNKHLKGPQSQLLPQAPKKEKLAINI